MSEINKNSRLAIFDNMSTEELEEILRQDSELPQDEKYDMSAIIYIAELIAQRERKDPKGRFTNVNKAWKSFMEDYYPIPCDGKTIPKEKFSEITADRNKTKTASPKRKKPINLFTRTASVAAIVAVVLLIGTVTAYAMGINLWSVIAQWTDETFNFSASEQTKEPVITHKAQLEYNSLPDALIANDIKVPLVPKWIPEGFEQTELQVCSKPFLVFCATYTCSKKVICINISEADPNGMNIYQKDKESVSEFVADGITHYIMSNLSLNKAIWQNGSFECSISGDVSKEELERMITSIYEGQ